MTLLACARQVPPPPPAAAEAEDEATDAAPAEDEPSPLDVAYAAAVEAAETPTAEKIYDGLTAITPDTEGLIWDEQGRVAVVNWSRAEWYVNAAPGDALDPTHQLWVTPVPELQRFCAALELQGEDLTLRLEQHMGLPPGDGYDALLEIYVDPADLFRPCPDPEIDDTVCGLEYPPDVIETHRTWMEETRAHNYSNEDPMKDWPWTALGYTYDWGNPDAPYGGSEYILPADAPRTLRALVPTDDYCAPEPSSP